MPSFRYKAVSSGGETLEGLMEAASEAQVIASLKEAGHFPISASPAESGQKAAREPRRRTRRLGRKQLNLLTRELARMTGAGVSLEQALVILERVGDEPAVNEMLSTLLDQIRSGKSFSEALESYGRPFDRLYISMVRAGEASGGLAPVLERLADYLARSEELRSSVVSALIYPAILLAVSILSLILLMTLVVPQFEQMFDDAGAALPTSTQIVIGTANWLQDYWWSLLLVLLAALVFLPRVFAQPAARQWWDGFLLNLPRIGSLVRRIEIARFARTLSTLLRNGVVLMNGLVIVRDTVSNSRVAAAVGDIEESLKAGNGMAQAMQDGNVFPKLAAQMVSVGEESGRLDDMLADIADIYDQEVEQSLKRLIVMLEPLVILTLGIMIAGIIVSILMAVLSMNELAF